MMVLIASPRNVVVMIDIPDMIQLCRHRRQTSIGTAMQPIREEGTFFEFFAVVGLPAEAPEGRPFPAKFPLT